MWGKGHGSSFDFTVWIPQYSHDLLKRLSFSALYFCRKSAVAVWLYFYPCTKTILFDDCSFKLSLEISVQAFNILFFFKIVLTILDLLQWHISFRNSLEITTQKGLRNFDWDYAGPTDHLGEKWHCNDTEPSYPWRHVVLSLHLLGSSLLIPSNVLWLSVSRSCIDKFIPKDNILMLQ